MTHFDDHLAWIDAQQEHMLDLLRHWASINTGTYNVAGLRAFADHLVSAFHSLSPYIAEIPLVPQGTVADDGTPREHPLGVAISIKCDEREGGGGAADGGGAVRPRVLLGIHYDTVFSPSHPFQTVTQLDHETLRGPGACDAKGGLLVMLLALRALERSPFAKGLAWEVLLNPDEEVGSPGSGRLFAEAARRNDVALLFEPALPDGALVSARKGSENRTLVVRGRAAHAGRDISQGRNAVHALARLITELADLQQQSDGLSVNAGVIHSGPGAAANIVPDFALARINVRAKTIEQQRAFDRRLAELIAAASVDGITVESHGLPPCPPKPPLPGTLKLLEQFGGCAAALDEPLTWRETGGVCDGNRTAAAGCPTIDSLGPIGGGMHTDQEFVNISSLVQRASLTALFLMRLGAGEIVLPPRDVPESAPEAD